MPKSAALEIAASLRGRISAGEWARLGRLPDERALAGEYKVARNTLRRAVDALAQDGLLARQVGRGTFLRAATAPAGEAATAAITQRIAGASPLDMMAVRLMIEPRCAALAAGNASAADLRAIEAAHEAACAAPDMPQFEHWDAELHARIFTAARNELLSGLHDLLRVIRSEAPWIEIKRRSFSEERRARYCEEHGALVAALARHDGEAAAVAMRAHLESVQRNLFGAVG